MPNVKPIPNYKQMSYGRTGTRVRSLPIAARMAATIAGVTPSN